MTRFDQKANQIFKNGSVTYYYSSLFFPAQVKKDVFILYSFVRTIDNYVDTIPPQSKKFKAFHKKVLWALKGKKINNSIISNFLDLAKRKNFKTSWIHSFFKSMRTDFYKKNYQTFKELEDYMYGSAEIIGLMMAKILDLPPQSYKYAMLQGKAMQLINFIRDIDEDLSLGRIYIPKEDLVRFKIKSLKSADQDQFKNLIDYQLKRYRKVQKQAEKGYKYLPKKYLLPIKTSADLYLYAANKIEKNPQLIFQTKVKASKQIIFTKAIKNYLTL